MKMKDEAKILEDMIDHESIMDFDEVENPLEIEKPAQDMAILDPVQKKELAEAPDVRQDMIDDYHYARNIYLHMIDQSQELVTGILELAQQAPTARNFEVASNSIKNTSDLTDKLMKISKEFKELNTEVKSGMDQTADTIHNTNVVFNGSAEDLIKMLDGEDVVILDND